MYSKISNLSILLVTSSFIFLNCADCFTTNFQSRTTTSSDQNISQVTKGENVTSTPSNEKPRDTVYVNESEVGNLIPMATQGILDEVYVMNRELDWTNNEFPIYNSTGGIAYTITNKINGSQLAESQFAIIGPDRCLRPRLFMPDRWYLSGDLVSPLKDHAYEFRRGALSFEGDILTLGTHTRHAKISSEHSFRSIQLVLFASESLGYSLSFFFFFFVNPDGKLAQGWIDKKIPGGRTISVFTDGTIPLPNLISLIVISVTRIKKCGF
ncbi:hypothetical protein BY996DRAFT_1954045 [Phakopsora pachyrhizi]|nr:hypothetical protein BY996DRAFT_1954045 [Phakopsora pachyrhizi]